MLNKITKNCGWCDDPFSKNYNKYIKIKKRNNFTYEKLWREDNAYDILINLDYNQNPKEKVKEVQYLYTVVLMILETQLDVLHYQEQI